MLTEIYKKLEKKYDNILFLLEEPLIYEGTKLKLLWKKQQRTSLLMSQELSKHF